MVNQIEEIKSACNQIHMAMHAISDEYRNQSTTDGNPVPMHFKLN